jgi:hypothetical protein
MGRYVPEPIATSAPYYRGGVGAQCQVTRARPQQPGSQDRNRARDAPASHSRDQGVGRPDIRDSQHEGQEQGCLSAEEIAAQHTDRRDAESDHRCGGDGRPDVARGERADDDERHANDGGDQVGQQARPSLPTEVG